jgi:hypothetical protein
VALQPGRPAFQAVGRCYVRIARLFAAVGQGQFPELAERARSVDAALDEAEVVARWGKARSSRGQREHRRARQLLRCADRAATFSILIGRRLTLPEHDTAGELLDRQVAADVGAGFVAAASMLVHRRSSRPSGRAQECAGRL